MEVVFPLSTPDYTARITAACESLRGTYAGRHGVRAAAWDLAAVAEEVAATADPITAAELRRAAERYARALSVSNQKRTRELRGAADELLGLLERT